MLKLRILVPLALLTFVSCGAEQQAQTDAQAPAKTPSQEPAPAPKQAAAPEADRPAEPAAADAASTTDAPPATAAGSEVVQTMNSGGYTYVLLDEAGKQAWYAVPETKVAVGDRVTMSADKFPQHNFKSGTLDRVFATIYFCSGLKVEGASAAAMPAVPAVPEGAEDAVKQAHAAAGAKPTQAVEAGSVARPEGGVTVAEAWALGKEGAGKEITLRGKVVKYNAQILGSNWLHVQDGTGSAADKTNDLTVTTTATAKVGDTVLITGKLAADRDFGYGYFYKLLIEDAKVTVE